MPTNSKEYYEKNKHKYRVGKKANEKSKYRKRARRKLEKAGRVRTGDGKEVDHKDGNVRNNSLSNLRVVSKKTNRSNWAKKANSKRRARSNFWRKY